jgi:prepilin-type processing-associated H-X9-DG protein
MAADCTLYEDLLVQEALGENSEKERAFLKAHLDSCSDCRSELARLNDTIGVLKRERREGAPAGLAERTLKRIERTGERFTAASSPYHETRLFAPGTWQVRRSLVGWMVAASILVMAVASLVPGMMSAEGHSGVMACQDHMRLVAVALRQYANDHDGFYPQSADWYKALDYGYLQREGALLCPGRFAVGPNSDRETDYLYNPARVNVNNPGNYPLMWDRQAAHERLGRNVLFADGSIKWMAEDEFEKLLARHKINEGELFK